MDKYGVAKQTVAVDGIEVEMPGTAKFSLGANMAAIWDLKNSLEPKLDAVTVDVNLLRANLQKMSKKVSSAELCINLLQSMSKNVEEQVQYLTKHHTLMAARLEDQEDRARRNNIRVVGVHEGAEGLSVDFFLEDLIVKTLRPNRLLKFFTIEQRHRALILKPRVPQRTFISRVFSYRDRDTILQAARSHSNMSYENTMIWFFPDFTLQV
ncbi:hypothetical protein NDU88_006608 [Pleurodeles waltl]|uniref:Uncharacterized protein n=1 Tax=Pleurodeles waltl TaxID=8319 RepID=A0AAV7MZQ6_PLEWA|nr:hypothetical protein NDU88_006608 [Pleurodeles waltl]